MQFSSTEFFQKKKRRVQSMWKRCFIKLLFCKFTEKRETRRKRKHRGTFLTSRRTNKQGTEFSFKRKETVTKGNMFCFKNIAFLWRRECTKKENFKKNWVYWRKKNDSEKRIRLFKAKFFFFSKKSWKDKKTGDAKGEKGPNNNRNQKEGQGTRKMCPKKKRKRESRRERKKNGWKKGYTKEVLKKEARGNL